ncbi:MAG: response regulator [Patescibacteria group bacterium]
MNILIVEPDKELAKTIKDWLITDEWNADTASIAQEALDCLDEEKYDAIVLELVIPHSNGVEFLQSVRSYPEWQGIPCIIYTSANIGAMDLPESAKKDLNIIKVLYKSKNSLADISAEIRELTA